MRAAASLLLAVLACGACSSYQRFPDSETVYRRVKPAVAYEILRDSPNALILDLRSDPGLDPPAVTFRRSRRLPLAELPDRLAELDGYRDSTFLVYCGGDAECGIAGMRLLVEHGCTYAVLIDGPFDGWGSEPTRDEPAEPAATGRGAEPPSGRFPPATGSPPPEV